MHCCRLQQISTGPRFVNWHVCKEATRFKHDEFGLPCRGQSASPVLCLCGMWLLGLLNA
jgi:hypothetical protein